MNQEEFINAIRVAVENSAVKSVETYLIKPPGRSPNIKLLALSDWYNKLSKKDQNMVLQVVKESVNTSIFGFLCVLDGVKAIGNSGEKGRLSLYYEKGQDRTLLNDFNDEFLHDLFSSE
ncbi:MAG TPA: hypothetical protein VK543_15345 [Puia sp.]|nr:hypothetical protein [Puia sp.]